MTREPERPGGELHRLAVEALEAGSRLDLFLAGRLDASRSQIQRWIRAGRVAIDDDSVTRPAASLAEGQVVTCRPPAPRREGPLQPQEGPLEILWEDASLVVVVKAAGVAVHPGAGRTSQTLANFLLYRYPEIREVGHAGRPGIVHRLDMGTTGALVVARTHRSYRRLAAAFAERRVRKLYLAVVYGRPRPAAGRIESPIARDPRERKRMAVASRGGREALTVYRTLVADAGIALLELDLRTGRTHQIRVHLKSRGHPLVGDPVYGEARWKTFPPPVSGVVRDFPRPALHAWRLAIPHPESGEILRFEAPLPEDMRSLWRQATGSPPPLPGSWARTASA